MQFRNHFNFIEHDFLTIASEIYENAYVQNDEKKIESIFAWRIWIFENECNDHCNMTLSENIYH